MKAIDNIFIERKELRTFSSSDNYRNISLLLFDWILIIGSIWINHIYSHPAVYLVSILIVGGRMMGFWSLLHEGNHNFIVKNKTLNNWITKLFIAWPLFRSFSTYQKLHRAHHKFLSTENDPNSHLLKFEEFKFPMKRIKLIKILLFDLLGINFIRYFFLGFYAMITGFLKSPQEYLNAKINNREFMQRWFFYLFIVTITIYFGMILEFILYWIIPYVTWHYVNLRMTLIADHCFAYNDKTYKSRTVLLSFFEQFFMVPHHLNYHNEHHLYGNIPCYNLSKLHKKLMMNETYRNQACVVNGYLNVLRQVSI